MRLPLLFLLCVFFAYADARPKKGVYRGVLVLDASKNITIPFNFNLYYNGKKPMIVIRNADENIIVDEIRLKGDSVNFRVPVFDTEFRTRITQTGLEGVWINHYRRNEKVIPFYAIHNDARRFAGDTQSTASIEGRWKVTFSQGTANEQFAVGLFHHVEQTNHISGTFMTETGDYRFLDGILSHDTLLLSAFDGSHAYLFVAHVSGDSIVNGMFYSGTHWQEPWIASREAGFKLRDAASITGVKDTSAIFDFSFKNTRGKVVSLSDRKYRNKPVIIQVMGSWCANCMDESIYLSDLYRKHKSAGLEIIALAFEKAADEKKAMSRLKRMKQRLELPYEVLYTGAVGKDEAARALPVLTGISAFPTTVFLDRNHKIVKVHTGFSGPATGHAYDQYRSATDRLIKQLLQ